MLIRHLGESLNPSSSPFYEPQKLLDILRSHTVTSVSHFPGCPSHFLSPLNHIDVGINAFLHRRNRYAIARRRHVPLHTHHKTDDFSAYLEYANSSLFDTSSYYFLSQFTYWTSRCQVIISLLFTCCILDIIVLFAGFIDMHNQTDICPSKILYALRRELVKFREYLVELPHIPQIGFLIRFLRVIPMACKCPMRKIKQIYVHYFTHVHGT